ncbi:MAG: right-handed parallel beta-helix repeat-containing protein [Bacteroidales bacterium]|nr:right-handed parallel beta-helix repeat-containing protein [Bacteroidales bacterium]
MDIFDHKILRMSCFKLCLKAWINKASMNRCFILRLFLTGVMVCSFINVTGTKLNCRTVYNHIDATLEIQNAINSGADTIIIPYMGIDSIWISGPLSIANKEDICIILEPGVILESKSGSFINKYVGFLTLNNSHNIRIIGYKAEIRMLKQEYSDVGQWRHGISVLSSDSIEILGVNISSTGGDGIYVGSNRDTVIYSSNVVIRNVVTDKCARNGISIIACRNLLIEDCEFLNTGRGNRPNNASNGPWAGIDLEPNFEYELLDNIVINNCILKLNRGAGILYAYGASINDILISNNQIIDNKVGISLIGKQRGNTGKLSFVNNVISGKHDFGLYISNWIQNDLSVNFDGCTFDIEKIPIPVKFVIGERSKTPINYGNIVLNDTRFQNVIHPCLIYLEGIDSVNNFNNILLTNSKIKQSDKDQDVFSEKESINSSYMNKSVAGTNVFCVIEKRELVINYYPNPVVDSFQILCDTPNQIDLKIYDPTGKLVLIKLARNGEYIDLHSLTSGQYIIVANDPLNKRMASKSMIKL